MRLSRQFFAYLFFLRKILQLKKKQNKQISPLMKFLCAKICCFCCLIFACFVFFLVGFTCFVLFVSQKLKEINKKTKIVLVASFTILLMYTLPNPRDLFFTKFSAKFFFRIYLFPFLCTYFYL